MLQHSWLPLICLPDVTRTDGRPKRDCLIKLPLHSQVGYQMLDLTVVVVAISSYCKYGFVNFAVLFSISSLTAHGCTNQWAAHVEFTSLNSYLTTIAILHHSFACIIVLSVCTCVCLIKKILKTHAFNNQSGILQKPTSTWTYGPKQKSAFTIL